MQVMQLQKFIQGPVPFIGLVGKVRRHIPVQMLDATPDGVGISADASTADPMVNPDSIHRDSTNIFIE